MAKNMSIKDFEELNLYSNKSMETVMRMLVDESANAVLVSVYEDSVILLDHTNGQFYVADYKYDKEKYTFLFENFETIQLEADAQDFKEAAYDFFDDEEGDVTKITEAYRENMFGQNSYISELVSECMAYKDWSKNIDYDKIVNKQGKVLGEAFAQKYVKSLQDKPLNDIKFFDWKTPVSVCINEEENPVVINKKALVAAADLWKNKEFKGELLVTSKIFVENVEEGTDKFVELFKKYPQLLAIEQSDLRTVFGKALLSTEMREKTNEIVAGVKLLCEKFDVAELKEQLLGEGFDPEMISETDAALDLSEEELTTIRDALMDVGEASSSESLQYKIATIIESIEEMKSLGVRPAVIRDAISILSIKA